LLHKLLQTLRLGTKSLLLHKLRSSLAALGILIGVTSVIWLVALGEGVSLQAQRQIKDLGATNIIVRTVKPPAESSSSMGMGGNVEFGLLRDDFDRFLNIPTVVGAVPLRELNQKEARYLDRALDVRIVGCRAEYLALNHLKLHIGRFISAEDEADTENVCVLAWETARTLFRYENPLGKSVFLNSAFYVVVGVTEERGATGNIGGSFTGQDYDKDVYIPLRTLKERIGDTVTSSKPGSFEMEIVQLSQITLTVRDLAEVDETAEIVKHLLAKYHKQNDYALTVPKELLKQAEVTRMMFNVLLVIVAGISLFVGGIGIMNIMLATVTERTREIGVRRALGAKQRDIVYQFLTETLVLSGIGGLLGVLAGFSVTYVVDLVRWTMNNFFAETMAKLQPEIRDITPHIAPWSVVSAFVISIAVGVVFGLYPAKRASQMDPIEALRHE
jgi:putative ABC transport system permease protein